MVSLTGGMYLYMTILRCERRDIGDVGDFLYRQCGKPPAHPPHSARCDMITINASPAAL